MLVLTTVFDVKSEPEHGAKVLRLLKDALRAFSFQI